MTNEHEESIKWQVGNSKYEIHTTQLKQVDLAVLLPHCIEVRNKVLSAVSAENHCALSLFRVFPRTISAVLRTIWDNLVMAAPNEVTEADFTASIQEFVASHVSAEDRHDLLVQLRSARKPRDISVQTFYYRIREINDYLLWMPGDEMMLSEEQLKQAFYDAMPNTWRERFLSAGKTVHDNSFAEVVHYFRQQESLAAKKIIANEASHAVQQHHKSYNDNHNNKKGNKQNKFKKKPSPKTSASKKKRVDPNEECPFHSKHKWADCFENIRNAHSPLYKKQKEDKKLSKKSDQYNIEAKQNADDDKHEKEHSNGESSLDYNGMFQTIDECFMDYNVITNHFASFSPQIEHYDCSSVFDSFMTNLYVDGESQDEFSNSIFYSEHDNFRDLMNSLKPIGILKADTIQNIPSVRPFKVLFDTGSENTFINVRALPKDVIPSVEYSINIQTLTGMDKSDRSVLLKGISLPEFSPTKKIDIAITAFIFNHESIYDMIVGNDVLLKIGFDFLLSIKAMKWFDTTVPWKNISYFQDPLINGYLNEAYCFFIESPIENSIDDHFPCTAHHAYLAQPIQIKESKYELVTTQQIIDAQLHLSDDQRKDLFQVLEPFQPLFNGNLIAQGKLPEFNGPKVSLELLPGSVPVRSRPYPVPLKHREVFKHELDRLVNIGILSRTGPQEWLSPTFIVPKKDGRVRWVSDFRALNKCLKRKVYNLPRIHDILTKRNGYRYFTKIDISMQYYCFELDDSSKDLCTITTPFGNYRYNRLPMGIKQSPDIAQANMENLFRDFDEVDVYIDDSGIFSNNWKPHIESIHKVLSLLLKANFTVNPLKCEWAVQETDWLGYWLTPYGLKPWRKKIDAILALNRPQTIKDLRSFIGGVTFYRDMFHRRSHILAPLTSQVGKKILDWTSDCEKAFQTIKAVLSEQVFLKYPDHNKPFHIYCDASAFQLGAAIFQDNCPVAFYSRKLNAAQRNYTVGERELLSIVETFKEYRTMLYGASEIHVYTDHQNNTFHKFNTQRVLRWRLFLEEYGPIFHFIDGEKNTLADMLSRLSFSYNHDISHPQNPQDLYRDAELFKVQSQIYDPLDLDSNDEFFSNSYYSMAIESSDDLVHCFAHLPAQSGILFQLDFETIAQAQGRDAALNALKAQYPLKYVDHLLALNTNICCYSAKPEDSLRIYLPDELLENSIRWYHLALSHIGSNRLFDTMSMHFYNPKLKAQVETIVSTCDACQRFKNHGRGLGELAPREAALIPWQEVAVDLIGPWTLQVAGQELKFLALTIIDTVTNLIELVRIHASNAAHIALLFENTWLARYPRPSHCIHDQGGEFTGYAFQQMLLRNGIHDHCTTARNPQANSLCERMHLVVGNSLRTLTTLNPPEGIVDANQIVDTALANAMFAHRSAYNSAIKTTPGGLAFGHDMIMALPLIADLQIIRAHRQQLIDQRLIKANQRRFSYDYRVGQQVLKLAHKPSKLQPRALSGPHTIEQVHTNGTVTIRLSPTVVERISLRRIKPYRHI